MRGVVLLAVKLLLATETCRGVRIRKQNMSGSKKVEIYASMTWLLLFGGTGLVSKGLLVRCLRNAIKHSSQHTSEK